MHNIGTRRNTSNTGRQAAVSTTCWRLTLEGSVLMLGESCRYCPRLATAAETPRSNRAEAAAGRAGVRRCCPCSGCSKVRDGLRAKETDGGAEVVKTQGALDQRRQGQPAGLGARSEAGLGTQHPECGALGCCAWGSSGSAGSWA